MENAEQFLEKELSKVSDNDFALFDKKGKFKKAIIRAMKKYTKHYNDSFLKSAKKSELDEEAIFFKTDF